MERRGEWHDSRYATGFYSKKSAEQDYLIYRNGNDNYGADNETHSQLVCAAQRVQYHSSCRALLEMSYQYNQRKREPRLNIQ